MVGGIERVGGVVGVGGSEVLHVPKADCGAPKGDYRFAIWGETWTGIIGEARYKLPVERIARGRILPDVHSRCGGRTCNKLAIGGKGHVVETSGNWAT